MDVAKYIGLFLLKNNKCYVHGLGTLEIKRKSAKYDGESLHASNLEVALSITGNIDESLANYIATNEQISISKATKSLNDFSDNVKAKILEGETVVIPSLGEIAEQNNNMYFITAPQLLFTPPSIKAPKTTVNNTDEALASIPQQTQANFPPVHTQPQSGYATSPQPQQPTAHNEEDSGKINWGRIILVLLILGALIAGTYYVWTKYLNPQQRTQTITPPAIPDSDNNTETNNANNTAPIIHDSLDNSLIDSTGTNIADTTNTTLLDDTKNTVQLRVILNTYDKKDRATKRYKQLKSYGNKVEIIEEDTNYFFIALPIVASPSDTARILDSLSRNFNPDGVFIY